MINFRIENQSINNVCFTFSNTSAFRDIIKDVSVTLVPLPLDKIEMATSGNANVIHGEANDKNGKKVSVIVQMVK